MSGVAIETRRADGHAIVAVSGEVDMASADAVTDALEQAATAETGLSRLCCDLSGVTFLDSSGLGALVSGRRTCMEHGIEIVLAGIPRNVRRVLELSGVITLFEQFATVDEFDASRPTARG